jgi:hypothetical protein
MYNRWPTGDPKVTTCTCIGIYDLWHVVYSNPRLAKLHAGQIATALWKLYKEIEIK